MQRRTSCLVRVRTIDRIRVMMVVYMMMMVVVVMMWRMWMISLTAGRMQVLVRVLV